MILENFHYLNDDIQKQFAFDLRGLPRTRSQVCRPRRFWREKNRMAQFNGDLLDRVLEVPVEPWTTEDFKRVADAGAKALNVSFSDEILHKTIEASFSSIGVFQELLKGICSEEGIKETLAEHKKLSDLKNARQHHTAESEGLLCAASTRTGSNRSRPRDRWAERRPSTAVSSLLFGKGGSRSGL